MGASLAGCDMALVTKPKLPLVPSPPWANSQPLRSRRVSDLQSFCPTTP